MIRISLRDLQWRRRRFVIVVLVASLAFGLALVMTGVTNQLSNEGTNTVALFGADQWVVAEGVKGPFTSSQLIDEGLSGAIAEQPARRARRRADREPRPHADRVGAVDAAGDRRRRTDRDHLDP